MSSSVLRFYYNRKSGTQSRPQVLSEITSKLDHTNAPFKLDVPYSTSPFRLNFDLAQQDDTFSFNEYNSAVNFRGGGGGGVPVRNFSTRVNDQQPITPDFWKQRMAMRNEPLGASSFTWNQPQTTNSPSTTLKESSSSLSLNEYNPSLAEETKSGSIERDSVRTVSSSSILNSSHKNNVISTTTNLHGPNKVSMNHYKSALSMCIASKDIDSALQILETMTLSNHHSIDSDESLYISALDMIEEKTAVDDKTSSRLIRLGVSCIEYHNQGEEVQESPILIAILDALYRVKNWEGCIELVNAINASTSNNLSSNTLDKIYKLALRSCSNCSGLNDVGKRSQTRPGDAALQLVEQMNSSSSSLSSGCVLFVVRSLAKEGRAKDALTLFKKHGGGFGKVLLHALQACSNANKQSMGSERWDETALELLRSVEPRASLKHYNMTLSSMAAGGFLNRSLKFVDEMNAISYLTLDSYTWSTLLWACSTSQCIEERSQDEPNGACVALEIMHHLKQQQANHPSKSKFKSKNTLLNSQVYSAAIRAATGVNGPSYPTYQCPSEFRVDSTTKRASTLSGFKIKYGSEIGLKRWKESEDSSALGLFRNMIKNDLVVPPDVLTGLLKHTKTKRSLAEACEIALLLVSSSSTTTEDDEKLNKKSTTKSTTVNGWVSTCLLDDACHEEAKECLIQGGYFEEAKLLSIQR